MRCKCEIFVYVLFQSAVKTGIFVRARYNGWIFSIYLSYQLIVNNDNNNLKRNNDATSCPSFCFLAYTHFRGLLEYRDIAEVRKNAYQHFLCEVLFVGYIANIEPFYLLDQSRFWTSHTKMILKNAYLNAQNKRENEFLTLWKHWNPNLSSSNLEISSAAIIYRR